MTQKKTRQVVAESGDCCWTVSSDCSVVSRETQSRLESALDYLQDSLASMRDGAIIVDSRDTIAWANESAHYLTGIRFPEDRNQSLLNLIRTPQFQTLL